MCERCHYTTDFRSHFVKHLQKQIECPATHSAISLSEMLEMICRPKPFECPHCDKSFSHSRSRSRHINNEHPDISTINNHNVNTTNTESHNQSHNTETTNQSHNNNTTETNTQSHNTDRSHNTTNTNSNNSTVNINLNVFGKEELSHILNDEEFLTHCVRHITGQGLQKIIKSIWCNKDVPENHNVELKRERKPRLVKVFVQDGEGQRWIEKLADDVIDDMIQKGTGILQVHNNQLYRYDDDMTDSDIERHDIRSDALSRLKNKRRGYGRKRDAVLVELKNHRSETR